MNIMSRPTRQRCVYLAAVVDWYSTHVLSGPLSNTMEVHFYIEDVQNAVHRYGTLGLMNTDQTSQLSSTAFTDLIKHQDIRSISMDGGGAWREDGFIMRLERRIKYEDIYLHGHKTFNDAQTGLDSYFGFYNTTQTRQSHDRSTPDPTYFESLLMQQTAKVR